MALIHQRHVTAVRDVVAMVEEDVDEIRSYARPPATISRVMEAVSLVLGFPATWDSALQLLNDSRVPIMARVRDFSVASVKEFRLAELRAYTGDELLVPARVAVVSRAATSFARWVHAVSDSSVIALIKQEKKDKVARIARDAELNVVRFNAPVPVPSPDLAVRACAGRAGRSEGERESVRAVTRCGLTWRVVAEPAWAGQGEARGAVGGARGET